MNDYLYLTADAIAYYYDHAYDFVYDNIIVPARKTMPDLEIVPDQKAALDEISKYPRVSIESGHGTGKSALFSWIPCWFIQTRFNLMSRPVKVPVVAPTFHQLHDILWPEFQRWIPMSRLAPLFEIHKEEIFRAGTDKQGKSFQDSCFIRSLSSKTPDHVAGFHAPHLCWVIDEAFGIEDDMVWETIEGSMTDTSGDNRMVIGGQHTVLVGFVHDTFNKDKEFWRNLRFDSERSPLANKQYITRMERKFGRHSDVFRVRVKGLPPAGNPDAFIDFVDIEKARKREVKPQGNIKCGIDCARFGNDLTVCTYAVGNYVFPQRVMSKKDNYEIADEFLMGLRDIRSQTDNHNLAEVRIDNSGGYGSGVIDILKRNVSDNIRAIPIITEGKINDPEYYDGTSKMWGQLKNILPFLHIPDDDFLADELSTRKKKFYGEKLCIEPKKEYKKDHNDESPDRSDSLVLCMYTGDPLPLVLGNYTERVRRRLNIPWSRLKRDEVFLATSSTFDGGGRMYMGFYLFGLKSRKLWVYNEAVWGLPDPESIARDVVVRAKVLLRSGNITTITIDKHYGDDSFFEHGENVGKMLRKVGVNVVKVHKYDEIGAIVEANKMFKEERLIVGTECVGHDADIYDWKNVEGQMSAITPYCKTMSMVICELKERGMLKTYEDIMDKKGYRYMKRMKPIREAFKAGKPELVYSGGSIGKKPYLQNV